jgi:uncharacterized protein
MKNSVIADTGFWVALLNENNRFHQQAVAALDQMNSSLICTWPVITETSYFLQSKIGQKQACDF